MSHKGQMCHGSGEAGTKTKNELHCEATEGKAPLLFNKFRTYLKPDSEV